MDIPELLRLLNEHRVRYVLIGAAAFPAHGFSRTTRDIDIMIDPSDKNIARARDALKEFGYDISDVTPEEMREKKVLFRQYILETDIHPYVTGVEFDDVWKKRKRYKLHGVPTNFASLDDLITMKRAAGRPKDKEDLRYLLHIRKVLKEKKRKRKKKR